MWVHGSVTFVLPDSEANTQVRLFAEQADSCALARGRHKATAAAIQAVKCKGKGKRNLSPGTSMASLATPLPRHTGHLTQEHPEKKVGSCAPTLPSSPLDSKRLANAPLQELELQVAASFYRNDSLSNKSLVGNFLCFVSDYGRLTN